MQFTDDGFLNRRLQILQPKKGGFRAGVDSVFLAAAIPARPDEAILEAGTGPGVAACCLMWRVPQAHFTGIEKEPASAALARENLARNGLAGDIIEADILAETGLSEKRFQHGFANPPWFDAKSHSLSPHGLKARAHAADENTLELWVAKLASQLEAHGSLSFILPAQDEARASAAFSANNIGAIQILPICPRLGEPAIRILIQGHKSAKATSQRLSDFILHGEGHQFRPQAQAILREGEKLQLSS